MIERLKTYLGITDNSKDSLLEIMIENAQFNFSDMTNNYPCDYYSIIFKMVVEDYNRYGSEGIGSVSFGSNHESVLEDYSLGLQKQIRKAKRMRVL